MEQRSYRRGKVIFHEGDQGGYMCEVVQGSVGIYGSYGKPGQRQLSRVLMDGTFGEISLLDGHPRSAAAVAEEDTVLAIYTQETLERYFEKNPARILMFMEKMSSNLRRLTRNYMSVCHMLAAAEEDHASEEQVSAKML